MHESVEHMRPRPFEDAAAPLRSVRVGRLASSARLPRPLEGLRSTAKKIAWTAVEASRVRTPVRYAISELTSRRRGDYTLRRGGGRFSVRHRSGDVDIFRKFYAYGYYNLPEEIQARLGSLARPVDVLDLGANVGFFEVFTRERLDIGRVTCFEPDPANAEVLEGVRDANGADWQIIRACASNRDGRALFDSGRKNFSRVSSSGDADVACVDVFGYIAQADLVKMNIEGCEWGILQDARLADASAAWIVEYHRIANPQTEIHALCRSLFEDAGFTVRLATKTEDNGLLWAWKA